MKTLKESILDTEEELTNRAISLSKRIAINKSIVAFFEKSFEDYKKLPVSKLKELVKNFNDIKINTELLNDTSDYDTNKNYVAMYYNVRKNDLKLSCFFRYMDYPNAHVTRGFFWDYYEFIYPTKHSVSANQINAEISALRLGSPGYEHLICEIPEETAKGIENVLLDYVS